MSSYERLVLNPTAGTYADAAAVRVRERIAAGEFKTGGRLPSERALCEELGISRTVLREALSSLEALGIVESRSTRGWYVAAGDSPERSQSLVSAWLHQHADQFAEIDEVRGALEALCLRTMSEDNAFDAARRTRALLFDQAAAIERGDAVQAAEADYDFHRLLCSYTKNEALRSLVAGLIKNKREALAVYSLPDMASRSLHQHTEIVDALHASDRQRAAQLIEEHMNDAVRQYQSSDLSTRHTPETGS